MTIKTRKTAETEAKETKTLSRARKPSAEQLAKAKTDEPAVVDQPEQNQGVALEGLDKPVTGRGVFAVRTLGNAVSVEAAFLAEDGNVLRLPAVFPNREYALAQVEELRTSINQHFDSLAQAAQR